jgi:hypothetical protein
MEANNARKDKSNNVHGGDYFVTSDGMAGLG